MLGHKLVQVLQKQFDVWTTFRGSSTEFDKFGFYDSEKVVANIDVENFEVVRDAVFNLEPNVVINAIGIIKQTPTSNDVVKTLKINSIFPHQLAELTKKAGARLITVSTDCVFDGRKGNYKEEDISDAADLYGKSKNLGEISAPHCLTLRTSIIGRELQTAHSLVEWFLSSKGRKIRGFTNAVFSGFTTIVLAEIISDLIENHSNLHGLYHVSSEPISKFDLLCLLKKFYALPIEIEPDGDFKIDRSLNSERFRSETGFVPDEWSTMIGRMTADSTPYADFR